MKDNYLTSIFLAVAGIVTELLYAGTIIAIGYILALIFMKL